MTVYAVMKIRDGEPYEDPGAEEVESLHMSKDGAENEARAKEAAKTHNGISFCVQEMEVLP